MAISRSTGSPRWLLRGACLVVALFTMAPWSIGHAQPPTDATDATDEQSPPEQESSKRRLKPRSERAHIDSAAARFSFYLQRGTGFQSQDGWSATDPGATGRSDIEVYQTALSLGIAGKRWRQDVTATVDVVTGASIDAIDVMTSASAVNTAYDFKAATSVAASDNDTIKIRYGGHVEEEWSAGSGGLEYQRELWKDNITLSGSFNGTFDSFGAYGIDGVRTGTGTRTTLNGNVGYSQVLTPTLVGTLSYGITHQRGLLGAPWNSAPVLDTAAAGQQRIDNVVVGRTRESLPSRRLRHAFAGSLAKHFPGTKTSVHANYRYYFDTFDLQAHSGSVSAFQWVHRRAYIGGSYRLHWQSGVDFFSKGVRHSNFQLGDDVTADNDLDRFIANEGRAMLVVFIRPPGSGRGPPQQIDVGYTLYVRSNDLVVHMPTVGYQGKF